MILWNTEVVYHNVLLDFGICLLLEILGIISVTQQFFYDKAVITGSFDNEFFYTAADTHEIIFFRTNN